MQNETLVLEDSDDPDLSKICFHDDIIAPVIFRPKTNQSLLFCFQPIFRDGPDSIRRECEVSPSFQPNPEKEFLQNSSQSHSNANSDEPNLSEVKPIPTDFIENSQLYSLFRNDFYELLEFCLYPEKSTIFENKERVSSHSFALIEMIKKCRTNKLKTEQKVKKIINHAYDMMKRNYLNNHYKNLGHISDIHKKEVFVYYFKRANESPDDFIRKNAINPIWRSAEKFNLAYNKKFFNYVQDCSVFLHDLSIMIDKLNQLTAETIKNDLRLFIKDVVRFAYQKSNKPMNSYLPDENLIRMFFNAEVQKQLNKKGIKFPWTEEQYQKSIYILKGYVDSKEYSRSFEDN